MMDGERGVRDAGCGMRDTSVTYVLTMNEYVIQHSEKALLGQSNESYQQGRTHVGVGGGDLEEHPCANE